MRTVEERRAIFLAKAKYVTDQAHFDEIMKSFPEELRAEIYEQVKGKLTKPFTYPPTE